MQVHAFAYDLDTKAWSVPMLPSADSPRTLVLAFGAPEVIQNSEAIAHLARVYPRSVVMGCSSAGEIHGTTVRDRSISVTVAKFDKTELVMTSMNVAGPGDSFATGQAIAKKLAARPGLRGVLVLSEGLNVNGSELVRGLNSTFDESVVVAGGLSGDGPRFEKTWVAVGAKTASNVVAAVGFYGDFVQIGHGSKGGWDKFGPERVVTRSEGNVLYELDGKPALALYKEYLGDRAKDLPASGLLFPLSLRASSKDDKALVRTLLAVDHEKSSLTFAGDIPKGYLAQLMKADFDRLIGGASLASSMAKENGTPVGKDSLVVAISCVGRRLVLGDRIEEEVEAVLDALPPEQKSHITGFYSYGEISPYATGHCDLHNQTMTLTVFSESPTPLPKYKSEDEATRKDLSPEAKRAIGAGVAPITRPATPSVPPTAKPAVPAPRGTPPRPMAVESFGYDLEKGLWSVSSFPDLDSPRTLVLAFGAPEVMGSSDAIAQLAKAYPRSVVMGCSSAGEIHGTTVRDKSISVTVAKFDKTDLVMTSMDVAGPGDSFSTGQTIAKKLAARPGLRGVLVLSEGLNVNGSELVRGLNSSLDESVVVSGGLSGDGARFKQTWVAIGPKVKSNVVAAVGFYGDFVQIGHGSKGGWDKFGPERVVTRSEGNVLYELDGKPALALYKEYLGDKAKDLPASGLLFPLSLRASSKDDKALVRTLLAVDHEKSSLTFAGDIPKGYLAQLMKADFDRLIGGASLASSMAKDNGSPVGKDSLVVAISCVGRRLVLGDRVEDEVEAVLEALPKTQQSHITGFYSYGEISPYATGHCDLHNQTMTLTVFSESPTPLPKKAPLRTAALPKAAPPPEPVAVARAPETRPAAAAPAIATQSPTSTGSSPRFEKRTGPVTRIPLQPSGVAGANVQKAKHGDLTLLTITGRLTESFKGETLGRELRGTVVVDLAGIERITSFGVREWLSMLGAMQDVRRLYLLRASEAVANQLSMIRKFSGNGQIVSFYAPYLCGACGEQFERQFDCERDAEAIREGAAPDAPCPRCEGQGHFDDDARSYFAFAAPHLLTPVPEDIRALQEQLDAQPAAAPRDAVDKSVEGNQTRVRVNSKLGANIRWKRVLDGIEGSLVLDLGGVTGVEPAGLTNLEQALGALGPEVTKIVLERAPSQMIERIAQTGIPARMSVASAMIDAQCQTCTVYRPALVSIQEHGEAIAAGEQPRVHCKRCNAELRIEPGNRTLTFLRAHMAGTTQKTQTSVQAPMMPAADVPLSLSGMSVGDRRATDDVAAPAAAAATAKRNRALTFAVAALGVAVVGLGALQLSRADVTPASGSIPAASQSAAMAATATATTTTPDVAATASAPSTAWMQNVELPPAWVERPFVIEGSDVFVVGKGDLSATPEQAMGYARNDAIVRMVKQIQQELAGSPAGDFLQGRTHEPTGAASEAIANRYLRQFGTTASPERVDAALRKRESGIEGFARYKLPKATYQQVVASYRETASLQGMTVGKFFPLLETTMHSEGDLVVFSVLRGRNAAEQGVRPGDVVLTVGSRPVNGADAFNKVSTEEWASTPVRGNLSVDIESAGAKRTIRFFKPAPPGQ